MATLGRNVDGLRRANLSSVLQLVHHSGGASRSQLTASTGLTRSSVAVLVGELVELGLVDERDAPATNRVGRPSPLVVPSDSPVVISINPELDAVTVGIVGLSARVHRRVRHEIDYLPTPQQVAEISAEVVSSLGDVLDGHRVVGAALAVPGLVRGDGIVRWAPHLDWRDADLPRMVTDALGVDAAIGNDASLGALAERLFGVGRGLDDMVYLNGGASGIGGGVIVGGRPIGGVSGYAGEFGQNRPGVLDHRDRRTPYGVLEDEVSLARLLAVLRSGPVDEERLERLLLGSSAPTVQSELARQRRILGVALGNAVNVLNPSVVVLGGFLAMLHATDPGDLEAQVAASSLPETWSDARILPAALGADRLMIGAAELVFQRVLAGPVVQ